MRESVEGSYFVSDRPPEEEAAVGGGGYVEVQSRQKP